jgi:integrase
VDWTAGVIRVAGELERHFQRSTFQQEDDLVFPHPAFGSVLDATKLRRRFKAALGAAGVREVRFRDLRHTFGTRMAAAGAPLRALQEWMGHRDYATTAIYADYAPDPTNGNVWAERAFGAGTNPGTNLNETQTNSNDRKPLPSAETNLT